MMKKSIRASFAAVGCALLCLAPLGCSNDSEDSRYQPSGVSSQTIDAAAFIDGTSQIVITVPECGTVFIDCNEVKDPITDENDKTGRGSGKVVFSVAGMRLVYGADLTLEKTDAGVNLTVTFTEFYHGESNYYSSGDMRDVKQYLHVSNPNMICQGDYRNAIEVVLNFDNGSCNAVEATDAGDDAIYYDEVGYFYYDGKDPAKYPSDDYTVEMWVADCMVGSFFCMTSVGK